MKKILVITILLSVLITPLLAKPRTARAYIYENEKEAFQVVVDKKVKPVTSTEWFDNLPQETNIFAPQDLIDFKIIIKNTGDQDLENLDVFDLLPNYLKLIFRPGEYNEAEKKFSWKIDKLSAGERKEFTARAQVEKAENIARQQLFCLANKAVVQKDGQDLDSDTAQFCIEPRILGKTFPETGFNLIWGTITAFTVIAMGIVARKIGRGEIL